MDLMDALPSDTSKNIKTELEKVNWRNEQIQRLNPNSGKILACFKFSLILWYKCNDVQLKVIVKNAMLHTLEEYAVLSVSTNCSTSSVIKLLVVLHGDVTTPLNLMAGIEYRCKCQHRKL
jgi:hypothetical protein